MLLQPDSSSPWHGETRPNVHIQYNIACLHGIWNQIYFTVKPYDKLALTFSVIPRVKFIFLWLLARQFFSCSKLLQKGICKECLDLSTLLYNYCCKMNSWTYPVASYFEISILQRTVIHRSRDSVVGTATGYGLDDRGVGVRVPVRSRIFCSPRGGSHNLLSMGTGGSFPGGHWCLSVFILCLC
jgi:hypothetical protein